MLYLITGKNEFLREEFVGQLKALMHKLPLGEHNIDELGPGTSIAEVIAAASVTPFLSEKRMMIVRGMLGQGGRSRSNVWEYAGVNTFRAGRLDDLSMHPTVKPIALVRYAETNTTHGSAIQHHA